MTITFRCPHCHSELSFDDLSHESSPCAQCGREIKLTITPAMRERSVIDRCAICDCPHVYVQKDFNRTFGVTLFVVAAAISCWFYAKNWVWSAFGVLIGAAAADFILYRVLADVIICYKCHSQYRNFSPAQYDPFELGLAEKYDPKDKRKDAENPAAEWKQR
jgi:hypothetical protein